MEPSNSQVPLKTTLLRQDKKQYYLDIFESDTTMLRKTFADIKLISSDGINFASNKLFLSSMSIMFLRLLQDISPNLEYGTPVVVITNLTSKELKTVLHFVTFGQIPSTASNQGVFPETSVYSLLRCFGIDASNFSFTSFNSSVTYSSWAMSCLVSGER